MPRKKATEAKTDEQDPIAEQEARVAEARKETEARLQANEQMHADAQKLGEKQADHKQEPPTAEVIHSDRLATPGATVVVRGTGSPAPDGEVNDNGQEALGMAKMTRKAAQQPPSRSTGVRTVPTTTDEGGRPLVFAPAASLGTQMAKATGGQQVAAGGHNPGTVYSDIPTGGPAALPVYSDRRLNDADMPGGVVVPSGAVNPMRASMPNAEELSDEEHLKRGVVIVRANRRDEPAQGHVAEKGGMGQTEYLGGKPSTAPVVESDRVVVHEDPIIGPQPVLKPSEAQQGKPEPKAEKVGTDPVKAAETKAVNSAPSPGAPQEKSSVEIETKDVKSTPTTEQKNKPVETGTKSE